MALMSQRQYAAHRGVARSAVQRALDDGRIEADRHGLIDPNVADRLWEERTVPRDSSGSLTFLTARVAKTQFQARLAKLDYEERIGSLVSKDEMKIAAFNEARLIRDAMLNIPDRIAAMVAAETDIARCREIVATEILNALGKPVDGCAAQ